MIISLECIKTVTDLKCHVLIMGDFNYPGINWSTLNADSGGSKFLKLVLDCYLDKHVHEPTRMKNILDRVLMNDLVVITCQVIGKKDPSEQ